MEGNQGLFLAIVIGLVLLAAFTLSRKSYYSDDHPLLSQIRSNFTMLSSDYNDIPLREGNSAYTENKSVITLCLKDPENGKFYSMNTLMYVALHELGHIISKTHGHNQEFRENFARLLRRATKIGIYDPKIPIPTTYCGIGDKS